MKRLLPVLVAALPLVIGAACTRSSAPPAPAASRTVTDALGRSVAVPVRPERIVSLVPAFTETLFAVGAGPQVVGVTRHCTFPPEARKKASVGGFADAGAEPILALKPDLVLATSDIARGNRFDAIVAVGTPVFVLNPRTLAEVSTSIRTIGALTGNVAKAEEVAGAFEAKVAGVTARVKGREPPRALFLFSVEPPIAAGPGSFVDEVLRVAGLVNVAASAPSSYPRFGAEGIVAANPALVFTTVKGAKGEVEKLGAGVVHEVDPDLLERPGPRLADGLEALARIAHPEVF